MNGVGGQSEAHASRRPYRSHFSLDELTQALVNVAFTKLCDGKWSNSKEIDDDIRTVLQSRAYGALVAMVDVRAAFDATDTAQKLAAHQHTDMCRVARPGSEMAVFNEMKARVAELQRRGISVYAVKQENDYGQETWYRLMTDRPAEDAEGVPKEVA